MKVTLLISTYNWPEALDLVLRSLTEQSRPPDEILIADDGSTEETRLLVQEFQRKLELPMIHVWHEDKGFRRTVILNKAMAKATGDYIIQLDGDCIMHKDFIQNHMAFAKGNNFLFGSRVNIRKEYLPELFTEKKTEFSFFSRNISKRTRNLNVPPISRLYREKDDLSRKVRGCNLSYWKQDFLDVNGYNEDMTGWGKEDSELVVRFLNKGVKGRRLRYSAIIYHIWHKENSREKYNVNYEIQERAVEQRLKRCKNGIDKYLKGNSH